MGRRDVRDRPATATIRIRLTRRDRDLILQHTFIDGEVEARIRVARAKETGIIVDLSPDDLEELLGYVAAEANHSDQPSLQRRLYALYDRLAALETKHVDQAESAPLPTLAPTVRAAKHFTRKQGQYLAFIYYYTKIHGQPPAEADLQGYFNVSPLQSIR